MINSVGKINKTFYKTFIEKNKVLKSYSFSTDGEGFREEYRMKSNGFKIRQYV